MRQPQGPQLSCPGLLIPPLAALSCLPPPRGPGLTGDAEPPSCTHRLDVTRVTAPWALPHRPGWLQGPHAGCPSRQQDAPLGSSTASENLEQGGGLASPELRPAKAAPG